MAASDYTSAGGSGPITPVATLSEAVGPLASRILFSGRTSFTGTTLRTNASLMVGGEVMKVTAFDDLGAYVSRGCADTIPKPHGEGTPVWFIDDSVGTDRKEYLSSETISVKLLMRAGSKTMAVESAPPNDLAFVGRFVRPYPPGQVLVDGAPWFVLQTLSNENTDLTFTWAHRDRVLQGDVLQGHEVASIGPEPGTTYSIIVRNAAGSIVRNAPGISGTSWSYSVADARLDLGVTTTQVGVSGYVTLHSVRDGFESWQPYVIDFKVNGSGVAPNLWGATWGTAWGT